MAPSLNKCGVSLSSTKLWLERLKLKNKFNYLRMKIELKNNNSWPMSFWSPKRSATKRSVKTLPTGLNPSRPSTSSLSSTKRLSNQWQGRNSKKWLKCRTKLWRSFQQKWFTLEKLDQEHTGQEQWCVETTRHQMTTTRTLEVLMQHRSEQCLGSVLSTSGKLLQQTYERRSSMRREETPDS